MAMMVGEGLQNVTQASQGVSVCVFSCTSFNFPNPTVYFPVVVCFWISGRSTQSRLAAWVAGLWLPGLPFPPLHIFPFNGQKILNAAFLLLRRRSDAAEFPSRSRALPCLASPHLGIRYGTRVCRVALHCPFASLEPS